MTKTNFPAAAPSGDVTAERRATYTRLIRQQETALLRGAYRLCGRNEDYAQDLVQEALVRGYEAFLAGKFTEGTNLRAWLLRILTNVYINEYRHKQKWDAGIDVEALTAQGDASPENLRAEPADRPADALMAHILDEPLERALAALSEELRLCVILVDVQDMDYAEAARELKIPIGTVRSRLSRARKTLHTSLYDYAHQRRRA